MVAVIYNGDVAGLFLYDPDIDELDQLGTQYDLLESLPEVFEHIGNGKYVKRIGEGQYELANLPPEPPTPQDEIAQLRSELNDMYLILAEVLFG